MPLVSDANDISAIDSYQEWWVVAWPALVFPIDQPIGFVGPLLDQRDEEDETSEDTKLRVADLFIDEIDQNYYKEVDPNYEGEEEDEEGKLGWNKVHLGNI